MTAPTPTTGPSYHPQTGVPEVRRHQRPLPWLNRCERYFLIRRTKEHQRVAFAAFYLDDAQLLFHHLELHLELNGGRPTWPQFVQLVNARFGPPLTASPVGALTMLRRSGSVNDYAKQFMALSCRDTSLTEPLLVQLFITSLGAIPCELTSPCSNWPPSMTPSSLPEPTNSARSLATCHPQRRGRRRYLRTGTHQPRHYCRQLQARLHHRPPSTNRRPRSACHLRRSPSAARTASASIVMSSSSTDTMNTANASSASKWCSMRSVLAIHRRRANHLHPRPHRDPTAYWADYARPRAHSRHPPRRAARHEIHTTSSILTRQPAQASLS
jgi:hypothetical protein